MNCKECNAEFKLDGNRGKNQLYCSHVCRQRAAIKRYKDRIINGHEAEKSKHEAIPQSIEGHPRGMDISPRLLASTNNGIGINTDTYLEALNSAFEAKIEAVSQKLRADALERELALKSAEIAEIEAELDEDEPEQNGFLGAIEKTLPALVKSYKQEPQATIDFLKASISEITNGFFKKQ